VEYGVIGNDYVAPHWSKAKFRDAEIQARRPLEACREPRRTVQTRPAFCLTYIHQRSIGTLQMVEILWRSTAREEMEKPRPGLDAGSAQREGEHWMCLMQAYLQLPYLSDRVQTGAAVTSSWCCCPCLNDMRTARGESSLSELRSSAPVMWITGEPVDASERLTKLPAT